MAEKTTTDTTSPIANMVYVPPADRRDRALELAIKAQGTAPQNAEDTVARAGAFLRFLNGDDATTICADIATAKAAATAAATAAKAGA